MSENERPAKPWIRRRSSQLGIALLLFMVWSLAANQWIERGCGTAQSYGLVVTHFGEPAANQGCESEPGGPAYTDQYDR
ncbi:hypothetical protein [Streptomyces sp. IBSBF 2435]|uniref:hypothetical protein n=1 Tax=Streptomyces sp. IBSBF 2435 TaxID=2903531 RepID=UPI002FDBEB08